MRIVSGIQPSGRPHLGNYLGAIKQFIALQEDNECYFFIADLHALTEHPSPEALRAQVLDTAISYLALGLDPQRATLFVQSHIPAHAELMWLLATHTAKGDLERMTQWKDKGKGKKAANAGLFAYPVLMAADILLYKPDAVPTGEDQVQHLELTRRIARHVNNTYDTDLLPEPESLLPSLGARIKSLTDPEQKMSKSHGEKHYVGIFEDPKSIRKKIKSAITDSGRKITYDPKRKAGLANLIEIYAAFDEKTPGDVVRQFSSAKGYGEFKEALADLVVEKLTPFQERYRMLSQSKAHVQEILRKGASRAQGVAQETLKETQRLMGLR